MLRHAGVTVRDNVVHDNAHIGVSLSMGASDNRIEGNEIRNNGFYGLFVGKGRGRAPHGGDGQPRRNQIVRNRIYGSGAENLRAIVPALNTWTDNKLVAPPAAPRAHLNHQAPASHAHVEAVELVAVGVAEVGGVEGVAAEAGARLRPSRPVPAPSVTGRRPGPCCLRASATITPLPTVAALPSNGLVSASPGEPGAVDQTMKPSNSMMRLPPSRRAARHRTAQRGRGHWCRGSRSRSPEPSLNFSCQARAWRRAAAAATVLPAQPGVAGCAPTAPSPAASVAPINTITAGQRRASPTPPPACSTEGAPHLPRGYDPAAIAAALAWVYRDDATETYCGCAFGADLRLKPGCGYQQPR